MTAGYQYTEAALNGQKAEVERRDNIRKISSPFEETTSIDWLVSFYRR
jgi:hypothetical protein